MKNKLLTLAAALALAAILGTYYAKPLYAQARAAVVKNIDEPLRVPYQAQISCSGLSQCQPASNTFTFVSLPPVPAHSRLVIEQISLMIQTNGSLTLAQLGTYSGLIASETMDNPVAPPFTFLPITQTPLAYIVNQTVKYYFEAGVTPAIGLTDLTAPHSGAAFSVSMTGMATGYVVDLSQ